MDNLTAVMAALYNSSVAMTHSRQLLVCMRSYTTSITYFSERFGVREKHCMFPASVMDAYSRVISQYLTIAIRAGWHTHQPACNLGSSKYLGDDICTDQPLPLGNKH